jgi:hypothetical protein
MVEKYSTELLDFIQTECLSGNGGFQSQHRVFATKRGWFLRPTVKLDPVAEFFLYDFVYRNRSHFRKSPLSTRKVLGYRIVGGVPIPILQSYSNYKKAIAKNRETYKCHAYFDVAAYFNRIYHHDLVAWFEDAGASADDVALYGKFLREIASGRTVDCLPQGIYPAKMIGAAFLGFLENSNRIRCAESVRLMDDMWLFDDDLATLTADFVMVQSLLSDRGLDDKNEVAAAIQSYLEAGTQITEYQLFWFGMMVEDYLLRTPKAGTLVMSLYEHENATDISRAKVLEIPDKRFGLADLRDHPKSQRNHLLKYFPKSSKMNRIIGDFVENAF